MLTQVGYWGRGAVWRVTSGAFPSNAYACEVDDDGGVALVDPGLDGPAIDQALDSRGLRARWVVCTHGHFDHAGSAAWFQDRYGCSVHLHRADERTLKASNFLLMAFKIPVTIKVPQVSWVEAEAEVDLAGEPLRFLGSPGHTPGSCVLQLGTALFTGDTLYAQGVGLSKLPGEDPQVLRSSIRRLWPLLTSAVTVFPGHAGVADGESVRTRNKALTDFLGAAVGEVTWRSSGVAVAGVGHCLPARSEDNETLCRRLSVTPEWIVEKTGIQRRYIAAPEDTASDYATRAAAQALEMAAIEPDQVDLIIACTFSGDYLFPPLSAKVQMALKATHAQIFDLQANCTGFVTGLTVASDRMKADESVRHALVIGVEFCTRYIDRTDVNTAIYLSDGAGAAVISRVEPGQGIIASAFFTDSSNYEAVRMRGGGSSFPMHGRSFDPAIDLMEMNGIATWKQAITHLPKVIRRACEKSGVSVAGVDFMLFHQANLKLIEYIVRKMGLELSKTYTNVQDIGNTGAASLAIALSEAVSKGRIKNGDLVVLAAVGAGFNFGASVWRWQMPGKAG